MAAPKRTARRAGMLYLVLIVTGAFAHLVVRARVHVPGDAAATAEAIVANEALFRVGFVADLVMATSFLLVAVALYRLLHHVHEDAARFMVVLVAISVAIISLNLLNHVAALVVATEGGYAAALGVGGSDALALLFLDLHASGYYIAQVFFGLWLLPLGYLVWRSGMFPRALGALLVVACVGHLGAMLTTFLAPGAAPTVVPFFEAATLGELWLAGYLLVVGARAPRPATLAPATA